MLAKFLKEPSTPEASAASLPPRLLQLLPAGAIVAGWDSHPLKNGAFARRTTIPTEMLNFNSEQGASARYYGKNIVNGMIAEIHNAGLLTKAFHNSFAFLIRPTTHFPCLTADILMPEHPWLGRIPF